MTLLWDLQHLDMHSLVRTMDEVICKAGESVHGIRVGRD